MLGASHPEVRSDANLTDGPSHCFPTLICRLVFFRRAAADVVAAVPVTAAWIVGVNRSVRAPGGQRLARMDAKVIARTVARGCSELRAPANQQWGTRPEHQSCTCRRNTQLTFVWASALDGILDHSDKASRNR